MARHDDFREVNSEVGNFQPGRTKVLVESFSSLVYLAYILEWSSHDVNYMALVSFWSEACRETFVVISCDAKEVLNVHMSCVLTRRVVRGADCQGSQGLRQD
jgi:hypothetical protein